MSTFNNRKRAFSDAITVDAWHKPFDGVRTTAELHAHVAFGEARLGYQPGMRISFRLGLRRAEVVVVLPESEGLAVDKASVMRKSTGAAFKGRTVRQHQTTTTVRGRLSLMLGLKGGKPSVGIGANKADRKALKHHIETLTDAPMKVSQSMTTDDEYRWVIESQASGALEGAPWDADKEPRLTLVDLNAGKPRRIEPSVQIEVRCRREDLFISDIEITDRTLLRELPEHKASRRNEVAAECYIRDELLRNGLGATDLSNRFAEITLLSVVAEQA